MERQANYAASNAEKHEIIARVPGLVVKSIWFTDSLGGEEIVIEFEGGHVLRLESDEWVRAFFKWVHVST